MFTPGLGDYAYGWEVSELPPDSGGSRLDSSPVEGEDSRAAQPRTVYSHSGGMPGVSTRIWRVPAEERCIVVLGNTMQTNTFEIVRGIEHILAGRDPGPVRPRGDFEVARTALAEGRAPALARLRAWPQDVQNDYLLPDLAGLSRNLLEQERDADAMQLTDLLLEAFPDAPLAWDASAHVHHRTGDLATAIAHYGRLLELDPGADGIADLVSELEAELGR